MDDLPRRRPGRRALADHRPPEGGDPRAVAVQATGRSGSGRARRRRRAPRALLLPRVQDAWCPRMNTATAPTLTLRELNRAMLGRQLLLERARLDVVAAIERLPALQAQWAPSPYYALWARLAGFTHERLWSAIESHRVIRARLMRGTLHLVSARDFYAYAVATQDLQRGAWNRMQIVKGIAPDAVAKLAIAFAHQPRPKEEGLAHIQERVGTLGGPSRSLVCGI